MATQDLEWIRAHWAAIVDSSFDAIVSKDLEGRVTSWNRGAERLFGYPAAEMLGQPIARIIPLDLQFEEPRILQSITRGETVLPYDTERLRNDGTRIAVSISVSPIRDAQGRIIGASNIARDISDRKAAEQVLQQSELRMRIVLAGISDACYALDKDWRFLFASDAALKLWGKRAEDVLGRPFLDCFPEAEGSEQYLAHERVMAGGGPEHFETLSPVLHRWIEVSIASTSDGGLWLAFRDVDARRRIESALRESEAHLRMTDRQKDEFLAMLAHELRNPLVPIRNTADILERIAGADARAQRPLAMLRRQTNQLTRLVDDLLDVSRIAQGRIELKREPVEIAEVIDQAIETVQPLLREKAHQLVYDRPTAPIYLEGDAIRLVQIASNVLSNAAKFTDAGGQIRLEVAATERDLELRVVDSGSGIGSELLPHVFELFVQGERTLDRSQGGLGIGLSVVKRIVEMHGGSVNAQSAGLGRGTTLTIRLPRIPSPTARGDANARIAVPPRRILVVDDNRDAADSLAMLLQADGHQVEAVYSALSAFEAAERLQPEFILLDVGLPTMDGYEVTRRLRRMEPLRRTRILALTGYGQTQDRERALAAGCNAHLTKPADLDVLNSILAQGAPG